MPNQHTQTHDSGDEPTNSQRTQIDIRAIGGRLGDGTLASVVGGALFVHALWSRQGRGRVLQAGLGVLLVGYGFQQHRSGSTHSTKTAIDWDERGGTGTSEERAESQQDEVNPRGTSGEPDVETETDPDEGSVQFTEEGNGEPRSEPQLDEPSPDDPRLDEDDGPTEIDLSEASLADEASEAAGPAPEQAQPTQTEGTEPELTPTEDSSHTDEKTDDSDEVSDGDDERDADTAEDDRSEDSQPGDEK